MGSEIVVRAYREGDDEGINELFNLVFAQHRSLGHWRWKFFEAPGLREPVVIVAEEAGRIVGAFPSLSLRFKVGDQQVPVTQAVDNCILPEGRHGATQRAMYRAFSSQMRENGTGFVFGFPNDIALRVGTRLLGYQHLCPMFTLTRRLNLRLAVRRRLPLKLLEQAAARLSNWGYRIEAAFRRVAAGSAVRVERADEFDSAFDDFWRRVSKHHTIIEVRDRQYLTWRYGRNPHGGFLILRAWAANEMAGYLVWRVVESADGERTGQIMDFLTLPDPSVVKSLVSRVLSDALKERLDNVKIGVLAHHPAWDLLRREGFVQKSDAFHVAYVLYDESLREIGIPEARHWFLTLGDTDFLG